MGPQAVTPASVDTPEREVAHDLVRRGLLAAPVIVLAAGIVRGWTGATSAAVALAIVFANFLIAAALMTRAARSGPTALGAAAAGGYVLRMAIVVIALVVLRHRSWIDLPTLGLVIVGTHLGLLLWEMKYLSLSLAAPGLRPTRPTSLGDGT